MGDDKNVLRTIASGESEDSEPGISHVCSAIGERERRLGLEQQLGLLARTENPQSYYSP